MVITSKSQYYALHRSPDVVWNTLWSKSYKEWIRWLRSNDGRRELWSIRLTVPQSPYMRYEMSIAELNDYYKYLLTLGFSDDQILIGPCAPDGTHGTLQGEIMRSERYYSFWASMHAGLRMRQSLATHAKQYDGLQAKMLLDAYLDATSRDCLEWMLDQYPDSVIEFSCFSCPVGALKLNTLFWEIRNY